MTPETIVGTPVKKSSHVVRFVFGLAVLLTGLAIGLFFVFNQPEEARAETYADIIGTPSSGSTITGTYSHVDDGLVEGTSTYQWYKNGSAIAGATDIAYTPTASDVGNTLSFEVTWTSSTGLQDTPAQSDPIVVAAISCADVTDVSVTECKGLIAFFNSTDGSNWTNKTNWLGLGDSSPETVGDWYGVTVNGGYITQINLSNNNLSGHPYLPGLSNLTDLYLYDNQISSIESGDLSGLYNLNSLHLQTNQITSIESGDFMGLSALTTLWLSLNQISSIEPDTFIELSNLTRIGLNNNLITSIESGDFNGLSSLTELSLQENQISSIDPNTFAGLSNLDYLNILSNQITSLESGDFNGLGTLTTLWLSLNQISSIDPDTFAGLSNLITLSLDYNPISSIEPGVFNGLSSLDNLYLSSNQITSLESGDFNGLSGLTTLNLNGNPISSIEENSFSGLNSLNSLSIGYNCIDFDTLSLDVTNFLSNNPGFTLSPQYVCLNIEYTGNLGSVTGTLVFTGGLSGNRDILAAANPTLPSYVWTENGSYGFNLSSISDTSSLLRTTRKSQTLLTGEVTRITCGNGSIDTGETCDDGENNGTIGYCNTTCNGEILSFCLTVTDIPTSECEILSGFYYSTSGDSWNNGTNWLSGTIVDDWYGVTVSGGHIYGIDLSNNNLSGHPYLSGLSHLNYIYLDYNQISSIESGDFIGLDNLEALGLSNNLITSLEEGDFIGLPNLDSLVLHHNQITSIEAGSFTGLSNLDSLLLYNNLMPSLEYGDFAGLPNLTNLNLGYSEFTSIESGAFADLSNLTTLYLAEGNITSLEYGDFNGLDSLTSLELHNNNISSIGSGSFNGLNSVTNLRLDRNPITSLEEGDFYGLFGLNTLRLYQTQISSIGSNTFVGAPNLINLYLNENRITSLESGAFSDLSNLNLLYLYNNKITSIENGDFNGLSNLNDLRLDYNEITSIENNSFIDLSSLIVLHLYRNKISSIESLDFAGLPNLTNLRLDYNEITSIESGAFADLSNLRFLTLDNNQIASIDTGDFNGLSNLNYLYLQNNLISSVSEDLINLTNLYNNQGLNVNYNYINYNNISQSLLDFIDTKDDANDGDWRPTQTIIPDIYDYLCGDNICQEAGYCALAYTGQLCSDFSAQSCPITNGCNIVAGGKGGDTCGGTFNELSVTEAQCGVDFYGEWMIEDVNSCAVDCTLSNEGELSGTGYGTNFLAGLIFSKSANITEVIDSGDTVNYTLNYTNNSTTMHHLGTYIREYLPTNLSLISNADGYIDHEVVYGDIGDSCMTQFLASTGPYYQLLNDTLIGAFGVNTYQAMVGMLGYTGSEADVGQSFYDNVCIGQMGGQTNLQDCFNNLDFNPGIEYSFPQLMPVGSGCGIVGEELDTPYYYRYLGYVGTGSTGEITLSTQFNGIGTGDTLFTNEAEYFVSKGIGENGREDIFTGVVVDLNTLITPTYDLQITKTLLTDGPYIPGMEVEYQIDYTNRGNLPLSFTGEERPDTNLSLVSFSEDYNTITPNKTYGVEGDICYDNYFNETGVYMDALDTRALNNNGDDGFSGTTAYEFFLFYYNGGDNEFTTTWDEEESTLAEFIINLLTELLPAQFDTFQEQFMIGLEIDITTLDDSCGLAGDPTYYTFTISDLAPGATHSGVVTMQISNDIQAGETISNTANALYENGSGSSTASMEISSTSTVNMCEDIPESECNALIDFYNETDGDNRTTSSGRLQTGNVCGGGWSGVTCVGGHVTQLSLINKGVSGDIPSTIDGLSYLQVIRLLNNNITSLPSSLANISTLTEINVGGNDLGSIPSWIGTLTNLEKLDLSNNGITTLPSNIFHGLANLTDLSLNNNLLTTITATDFSALSSMVNLDLSDNIIETAITSSTFGELLSQLNSISLGTNCFKFGYSTLSILQYIDTIAGNSTWRSDAYMNPNCPVVVIKNTTNINTIKDEFIAKGYALGGGLTNVASTIPVGKKEIMVWFNDGSLVTPFIMQNTAGTIEVQFPADTVLKTNSGSVNYVANLRVPEEKSTSYASALGDTVISVASFGNGERIDIKDSNGNSQDVTIRIPTPDKSEGDMVSVYYSQDNGTTWNFHDEGVVSLLGSNPYIEFTTNHFTDFAILGSTGSFVINNDDASTTSTNVTLNIYAPTAQNMRFQNDGTGGARSTWESYATGKAWTLSAGAGTKTVYAQFDTDGNTSTIEAETSDDITLSTAPVCGAGGSMEGCIRLEINATSGSCTYGTSLFVDTTGSSYDIQYITGDNFTEDFECVDTEGLDTWTMTMEASTDLSNGTQTIPAANVSLIVNNAQVVSAGACTGGTTQTTWASIGSTPASILHKAAGGLGDICTLTASGVNLAVEIPAAQAVGIYTGTLALDMPW